MEVILSAAVSLDGYLDDASPDRLKLSSPEDWAAVAKLRAECDAILVGAQTVRSDNPSLVIRDPGLRAERAARGMAEDIMKVTITGSGCLDPASDFFTQGAGRKVVFAAGGADVSALEALPDTEVIRMEVITAAGIAEKLAQRGVGVLMVEGGGRVLSMFLREGCVDRMRIAVAPLFVGDARAPRFVTDGKFPWNNDNRLVPASVELLGDTTVTWYTSHD